MDRKLKILIASSEAYPFAKTGGLADVAGSLPKALRRVGHDVRVIMPKYKSAMNSGFPLHPLQEDIEIPLGEKSVKGFLFRAELAENTPVYLVENDAFFHRAQLYGENGRDYPDNAERFIFFCRAVLETCKTVSFQPDIIHCNDWQTGLIPVYLDSLYSRDPWYENIRTVFSIHNLGYQGNFPKTKIAVSNLPKSLFTPEGFEFYGKFSFLKAGLIFADLLTTVSKTYSEEIQTEALGFGMDGILRQRTKDLFGVLNGADYQKWDPERDRRIAQNYGPDNLEGKIVCKKFLANRLSLDLSGDPPILCMITRLSQQKGIDLIIDSMEEIQEMGARFVLLGTGDPQEEDAFLEFQEAYPGQCAAVIDFDEALAHQILAGSDVLLMPSLYEPCGLTQMYALKYGTAPLVHAVGGLKDTVEEFDPQTQKGTGFRFKPCKKWYLLKSLAKALSIYCDRPVWRRLTLNGMAVDLGWENAAREYVRLYLKALRGAPGGAALKRG